VFCYGVNVPRPRRYDDATRLHLIERAAHVLTTEGPHALSTRRVAAEAGTSTTALYTLIGGKEELLREMYREGFGRLGAAFDAVPTTDDPLADYWGMGRAYLAHALDNPGLYAVMFSTPAPEFVPSPADADFAWSTFQANVDAAQRCIDAGVLDGDAAEIASDRVEGRASVRPVAARVALAALHALVVGVLLAHRSAAVAALCGQVAGARRAGTGGGGS
jgi:AcrR family transcriptional regulator